MMGLKEDNEDSSRQFITIRNTNYKEDSTISKVAVIDLETTGLDPINDLIIEIGIVELNLKTCETKTLFNSYIKEPPFGEKHRDSWIFNNSDINFEDIQNAPPFEEFKEILNNIFDNYSTTAYNKSFDLGFLKARGIKIQKELSCIMRTATNICKIPFPNGGRGYKWPKCQEAWDFFFPNSEYIEKHRAADDAAHEAKILFELYKRGYFQL